MSGNPPASGEIENAEWTMALDVLTGMAVFRQAVEQGSLAAAGRAFALSPEMASRHLRSLEARLGLRLLNRSTRRLDLTPAGERYYARCVAVLDEVSLADREARAGAGRPAGRLRIAAPLAFSAAVLAEPLAAFVDRFPELRVELACSERTVDMLDEGFDVALRLGRLPDSDLTSRRLAEYRLMLVAAPAFLAAHAVATRPSDLPMDRAIVYTQTRTPSCWSFRNDDGVVEQVELQGRVSASDVGVIAAMIVGGHGLALLPEFAVRDDLAAGRLLEVLPSWRERTLPLHALYPHRTLVPAAVRELIAHLARALQPASHLNDRPRSSRSLAT